MSLSRRRMIAVLSAIPLAACAAPSPPTQGPSMAATSTIGPSASGEVVVFMPGALSAQSKGLASAFATSGATASVEVGHTPVQREQLAQGATPDVWIAADPEDMAKAAEQGLVDVAGVRELARTSLVVVLAPGNPAKITSVTDLATPGVSVLLAAETLPIWTTTAVAFATIESAHPGFTDGVLANTVSREMGVQPIVTKVTAGEADAGIVFVTDVGADAETVVIPDEWNADLTLAIAPVTAGKNPSGGEAFIAFMTEGQGQQILQEAGYHPARA